MASSRPKYSVIAPVFNEEDGLREFYRRMAAVLDALDGPSSTDIPTDTGDFRLIDRKVVLAMRRLREHHRFMRGLSVWVGFKQTGIRYVRNERFAGATQWPLGKMIRFAGDAITGFSY